MKNWYNSDARGAKMYQKWNNTTALCYWRKMECKGCPNSLACGVNKENKNRYRIKQIKFAVLMTYTNIGAPKKGEVYELDD